MQRRHPERSEGSAPALLPVSDSDLMQAAVVTAHNGSRRSAMSEAADRREPPPPAALGSASCYPLRIA